MNQISYKSQTECHWALAIARFQVLAHLRDHQRDRLLLDASLAETLSDEAEQKAEQMEDVRDALRHCLDSLTVDNQEPINRLQ